MSKVIGIDLGTTNSVAAIIEGGDPVVIPNAEGARLTPSVVAVSKSGERMVGQVARRQAVTNAENTVFSVKRFMGRKFNDQDIQHDRTSMPYQIASAPNGDVRVLMGGREYAPPEISAMILQKIKADAEAYLGDSITKAVITVPAYFDDSQRQATKDAGRIAGLEVLRIINEPTASALAYGLDRHTSDQIIAVYDMGGGTFDISILELSEGVVQVKATSGDTHLGGDDFDQRIIRWLAEEFQREYRIDLLSDRMALQRLKEAAEKAKIELSSLMQTEINLPFITADVDGPKHLNQILSRAKLEQLTIDLIERSMQPVKHAIDDAAIKPEDIGTVVLVGGQTRMPAIQQAVQKFFGKEPSKSVNPDEVVALGAAIQAGVLGGEIKDVLLLDVTPLTLGIQTLGGIMTPLIERNTTIPTRKTQIFSTASDNQSSVEIKVLQGERAESRYNKSLGCFELTGIPPAPRGQAKIEVTFDIDANGITSVSAKDTATNKEQRIIITPSSGLMPQEIDQMIKDADDHAQQDKAYRERIAVQNSAQSAIYSAERLLIQARSHLDDHPTLRTTLEDAMLALRAIVDEGEDGLIRTKTGELTQAMQAIHQSIHEAEAAAARASAAAETPPTDESPPPSEETPHDQSGPDPSSTDTQDTKDTKDTKDTT